MELNLLALGAYQLNAGSPIEPATPISPEEWFSPDGQGMEHETDLARLCGVTPFPLTLLTQRAGTTIADTGSIDQAQTPIGFWTPFLQGQRRSSRAAQRPVRLERKVLAGETTRFPGRGSRGGCIALGRSRSSGYLLVCRRELGGADWIRMQVMAQFQSHVPDPLTDDLPGFLSPGGMTTPTVGILL